MFPELPDCKTWECINSFAPWFSAFGTILVLGIALWLAYKDQTIQINADFDYGAVSTDGYSLNKPVYILSFCNVGRRNVNIINYRWKIRKFPFFWRYNYSITFPHREKELSNLCTNFPIELCDGQCGTIFHRIDFFEIVEKKDTLLFANSKLIAFFRIFTFKMVLNTSINKDIKVKIKFRTKKHIWKRYTNNLKN